MKERIQEDMKTAMKAKDSNRLGAIRLLLAAIKQREVDERITLDDSQILAVIDKMLKQRQDSVEQFTKANRNDLVDQELNEIAILKTYLPPALSDNEVEQIIRDAINTTGASGMKDMGKVMAQVKPNVQGRADMGAVSAKIKTLLEG